jgi:HNH endonuclease/AP2 domain
MKMIPISKGMLAIVDDEDFGWLSTMKWFASLQRDRYYAKTNAGVYMHRLIMGNPDGLMVDHRNGCTLDNRRDNLRVATRNQNQRNSNSVHLLRKHNTSGFRGVFIDKRDGGIYARILVDNKGINLGRFKTREEAARAYDEAAKKFHGEFATLNFKEVL